MNNAIKLYRFHRACLCPRATFAARTSINPYLSAYRALEHRNLVDNDSNQSIVTRLLSERQPAFKAVIFDKDGTLICFNSMWIPWAKHIAHNISNAVHMDLAEDIFTLLGVCSKTLRIYPGLLAEGTKDQIIEALIQLLASRGVENQLAESVTKRFVSYWSDSMEHLNELHDLSDLFTILRQHGIQIGICTSDNRVGTLKTLAALDVLHLVDVTMCGDDPDGRPKPDPHNARVICSKLGIKPKEAVMVGDTPTDVLFAKRGEFGLAIGVLSGVGQREDLEKAWYGSSRSDADSSQPDPQFHVLPSVADIIPLVLPDAPVPVRSTMSPTRTSSVSSVPISDNLRLIILDNNGTLTSVHPRWSIWTEQLCARLAEATNPELATQFLEILGYSPDTRRAAGGLLVESSMIHIKDCLGYLLTLNGYGIKHAEAILEQIWTVPELDPTDLIPGAVETIKELKYQGLAVAINTSDTRQSFDAFIRHTQLQPCIEMSLCAEDAGPHPKPLPHTMHRIMETLGCQPEQTIVVGDSPADLIAGRAAGVRLTVGVLSGFSLAHNLLAHANLLIPNVNYLTHLIQLDSHIHRTSVT